MMKSLREKWQPSSWRCDNLDVPEVNGVRYEDVMKPGSICRAWPPCGMWPRVEERREMVTMILEPGGMYYDVEMKEIAAITPRPAFLPVLRMLRGVVEYEEATGTLVTTVAAAEPTGFEPAIFCVTGRHVRPLHHGS